MNLSQLVTEAQRLAGRVDANFDSRTKEWLNEALERWSIADPWQSLTDEMDLVSDGTIDLFMPAYVGKVISIFEKSNYHELARREDWDRRYASAYGQQTAGTAYVWRELGVSPVGSLPGTTVLAGNDYAYVSFSHPGAAIGCYVEGITTQTGASGTAMAFTRVTENVTTASATAIETQAPFVKVLSIGKISTTTHQVTVDWSGYGPTQIAAVIEPHELQTRYKHIQLLYKPGAGTVFTVRYQRRLDRLTDDGQFPPPSVSIRYLIWWAAGNIHSAMGEHDKAVLKWQMADKIMRDESHHEKAHGDQDWDTGPDPDYWDYEESIS